MQKKLRQSALPRHPIGYLVNHKNSKKYEEGTQLRVKIKRVSNLTNNPITKEALKNKASLKNRHILERPWAETHFKLTVAEWKLMTELIDN